MIKMKNPYSNMNVQNSYQILRITWIGLAVNFSLAIFKFIVGFLGYSHAVVADAFHTLSDMSTDLAILLGVKFWLAPADENHPYGHRRIETIITAIIGIILAIVALGIAYNALVNIRETHLKQPRGIAVTGVLLSIIFKEILFQWTLTTGKRTKSSAVIANAWHHRSDALSSIPALIAVTLAIITPKLAFIDHIGALIVSIFILKVSWNIIAPSFSELSDSGAPPKYYEKIQSIVMGIHGVKAVHAIRTRKLGPGLHIDLHIMVNGNMTVQKGHQISEAVKYTLLEKEPEILDVVVHLEPYE
jgi:cation diffusion facilitator family transporter